MELYTFLGAIEDVKTASIPNLQIMLHDDEGKPKKVVDMLGNLDNKPDIPMVRHRRGIRAPQD